MPSYTRVGIISNALVRLGENPIQSESEKTAEALVATTIYEEVVATALSQFSWSFAFKSVKPPQTLIASAESDLTSRFDFVYTVPPEAINILGLRSRDDYEMTEKNQLWTNDDEAEIYYIREVTESQFKPWFVSGIVAELANAFCLAITGDNSRKEVLMRERDTAMALARNTDSKQRTPKQLFYMELYLPEPEVRF